MKSVNKTTAGFSLVETVIAIGIMALAVTALLGLLPQGIEMTRQAGNENAYARILSSVRAEINKVGFKDLDQLELRRLTYDDQGVRIFQAGGTGNQIAYVAEVDFNGANNRPLTLPGGSGAEVAIENFSVRIVASPLQDYNFLRAPPMAYRTYPIHIARNF
jgi:uncharacterized protein (TIGR02598 family)